MGGDYDDDDENHNQGSKCNFERKRKSRVSSEIECKDGDRHSTTTTRILNF